MGTSLLAMPWALQQAGLVLGIFLMLLMAAIAFYTAYRVVQSPQSLGNANVCVVAHRSHSEGGYCAGSLWSEEAHGERPVFLPGTKEDYGARPVFLPGTKEDYGERHVRLTGARKSS